MNYCFGRVTLYWTDDLEKRKYTSPKQHQALCIISTSYMNSNWNYGPETAKSGLTSVTLTFDLWPWPFARTSLLSLVITPENFRMIRWWEGTKSKRCDGQTDRQADITIHRAAWSQLKTHQFQDYNYHMWRKFIQGSLKWVALIFNLQI